MRKLLICAFALVICAGVRAQVREAADNVHSDPGIAYAGPAVFRAEFVSYDVREYAETGDLQRNQYYMPIAFASIEKAADREYVYTAQIYMPVSWLEREVFIQACGLQSYYMYINDRRVGYASDGAVPAQFDISAFITTGVNTIEIVPVAGVGVQLDDALAAERFKFDAFLFSQPKLRIHDYVMRFEPDPKSGRFGFLDILFTLSNDYNYEETITVGYDIYSPQGKLLYYDFREITLAGNSRDTMRFREPIWRANDNVWSIKNPVLHYGQLTVKRGTRMTEYIPYYIGYDMTAVSGGRLLSGNEAMSVSAVRYNAAATEKETSAQVDALKGQGYNTLCPDYPQPVWFYSVCDRLGVYVIDRPNINSATNTSNRKVGGALSNNPQWLGAFEQRTEAMYERTKNHTCILARGLGGDVGNGYNMYRTYLLLKGLDPGGIVIYNGAAGEWNNDWPSLKIAE